MMLASPVVLILAQLAGQPAVAGQHDGVCEYPQELQDRAAAGELAAGALVTCNRISITRDQVSFGLRSWETQTRFNGVFEEDNRMTVTSVTMANGRVWQARGVCDLSYADGKLSNVACSAQADRGTVVANFRVSTINAPR